MIILVYTIKISKNENIKVLKDRSYIIWDLKTFWGLLERNSLYLAILTW
jgi:hypothetical protein